MDDEIKNLLQAHILQVRNDAMEEKDRNIAQKTIRLIMEKTIREKSFDPEMSEFLYSGFKDILRDLI